MNICSNVKSVILKVIQVKCPLDKGLHTPPVCQTCFCFLHILQTRSVYIHSAGCHSTSLKHSYCRAPHPVSWGTHLWVETSGKSWCMILLLALQRKIGKRQTNTYRSDFSPSNNAISSFACRIISGSGDGINNKNVSAFLYWQSIDLLWSFIF